VVKTPGTGRKLKAFSLSGADGDAIVESVEALFPDAFPEVNVTWDVLKEQLVVIGSSEQLELVEETLKQFAPPERDLEIFQLRNSDPNTIQTAINSLFADEPYATSPTVNKDEANSQVLVRGTKEQLVLIRQLLEKMGEPLTSGTNAAVRGRVRTVPIQRDSEMLLEQLQKVWPQVRNNPLEIVRVPNETNPTTSPTPPSVQPNSNSNSEKPPRGPNPDPIQEPVAPVAKPATSGPTAPPVVVIPGDRQWTIASEDVAALDQFESLLAAGMRQPVLPAASTGNYSVYMLRHADADELQQLFTSLFRRGSTSGGSSGFTSSSLMRTTFVADTRINALVMYGGNADRTVIEELLSVLDSDELINQLQLEQPTLLSVENTDAQRVIDVLEDVYANQLRSDGGRKPLTIPEGISADVATILQQINAETVGPLLTLGVETTSNSIVMRGPGRIIGGNPQFCSAY
jgi:type II secretory pathway component GspD/PulD (secretin)